MIKRLIVAAAALSLAACATMGAIRTGAGMAAATADAAGVAVPATTTRTMIDEKALTIAAKGVSAAAVSVSALVKVGAIKAGTPLAQSIACSLDGARDAVNAAEAARQVGNATSYTAALARAETAIDAVKAALANLGG